MMISIQSRGFSLSESLEAYVNKRLGFNLARAAGRIRRITVTLSDLNGPRGGVDKRCLVVVRLDGLPDVVVEDVQADLYAAIDRAAGRAGRTVMRRLESQGRRRHAGTRARTALHAAPGSG